MDTRKKDKKEIGFYRARLNDSDILYKVIDTEEFPTAISDTINRLKIPQIYVFFNDTEDAILTYEPVYGSIPWLNTHTWTLPSCRGKKLKEFYYKTAIWMLENTDYNVITMIVPESHRRQGLYLAHIGAKRQCTINDDTLYTFDIEQLDTIKCQMPVITKKKKKRRKT